MADKGLIANGTGISSYEEAVGYILDIPKFSKIKTSQEGLSEYLSCLNNPQDSFDVIHVAGTNGKGSVCAFLTSILTAGARRTGTFTSPHLERINERFQIDGEPVSDQLFLKAFQEVYQITADKKAAGFQQPTFFEFLFLMAMWLFREAGVSYVILETGLGGRLDATNVIAKPLVSIITSIGFDHTKILGDTIEAIASEKAGIIKPGIPVIYDGTVAAASRVIAARGREMSAPSISVTYKDITGAQMTAGQRSFCARFKGRERVSFQIPFIPDYQMLNAMLAVRAIEAIDKEDIFFADVVREGLQRTYWPGRMERIGDGIYLDGAHNPPAMEQFAATANTMTAAATGRTYLLFSVLQEKDYEAMIGILAETMKFDEALLVSLKSERGLPLPSMEAIYRRHTDKPVTAYSNIKEAWDRLLKIKSGNDKVFCVGSLYMAGEIKALLRRKHHD